MAKYTAPTNKNLDFSKFFLKIYLFASLIYITYKAYK